MIDPFFPNQGPNELIFQEVVVAPGQRMTICRQPRQTFRPFQLVLDEASASRFKVVDVKIGVVAQIDRNFLKEQKNAEVFSPSSLKRFSYDVCWSSLLATIVVENIDSRNHVISAKFIGMYRDDKSTT